MSVVKAYGRVCAVVCASCDGRPTLATCSRRYQCCQSLKQPVNVRTPEQCSRHIVARTNGKDRERASHWVSFPSSAMKCVLTSSAFRVLRPIRKLSRRYLLPSSAIQNSRRLRTRLCSHISVARVTALCLMQLRMLHLSVAVQLGRLDNALTRVQPVSTLSHWVLCGSRTVGSTFLSVLW